MEGTITALAWIIGIPLALLVLAKTIKTLASIEPQENAAEKKKKKAEK